MSIKSELEKKDKRTCLYDKHVQQQALMVSFGGFEMPLQYAGIAPEHTAVRERVGVFDVSHMGEVTVRGRDAERYVQHIFTNDVSGAPAGKVFYGMMCYPDGGTVDDLLVYKMQEQDFFLVINAANIDKDWAWMQQQAEGFDIDLQNVSDLYGQLAIQGPLAEDTVERVLDIPCRDMEFYTCKSLECRVDSLEFATAPQDNSGAVANSKLSTLHSTLNSGAVANSTLYTLNSKLISRTGYTGEDGFEIYASHAYINILWDKLIAAGVQACGLGCRDTLRFEVGLPLYGDELSADISPVMAGLTMFVKFQKPEFIGREALLRQKEEGVARRLVGIELTDKAIPRHGYPVLNADGQQVGEVTTGYHTLSTDKSVCMALVDSRYAALGTPLHVQIRKKTFPGVVVKKRFYDKHYKK